MTLRLGSPFEVRLGPHPDGLTDVRPGAGYTLHSGQLQLRRHGDRVRAWLNPQGRNDTPPVLHARLESDDAGPVLRGVIREAPTRALALPVTLILAVAFAVQAAVVYWPAAFGAAFFFAGFLRFLLTRRSIFAAHVNTLTVFLTGYVRATTGGGN
ncbi:hypothetical protein [uncultured Jatrophihabitans sp.]|uniref:hypothetical protein n=1 Tax=uncultured Jatrophihabitans sp. TaxID=1610747 RepID=UPI0035CAA257